jgi:hypothetical protein
LKKSKGRGRNGTSAIENDITERLEERAISYEQSGPSAHHTAALLREAKAEIERLRQFEPSPHPDGHDLR